VADAGVRAYLSLGSNLGDRLTNLVGAVRAIDAMPVFDVIAVSPVYETAPIGPGGEVVAGQPPYLNCALSVDMRVGAAESRVLTAGIERAMGRGRHGRWESRIIDIDLVLFGAQRIGTPELTVPHARMIERAFVLRPLVDLDAAIIAPGFGRLADLLPDVAGQGCELHTTAEVFRAAVLTLA
jgi:2-amino-4-hydroxy-6-hydroxymethyldihydropteridine diphosphokinase